MFRTLLISVSLLMGLSASATNVHDAIVQAAIKSLHIKPFATFNVGDTDNYSISISSMGGGTMVMKVTAVDSTGVTIEQDASIMGQTENIVEVLNPSTGAIISVTVNGQKQTPPDPNDMQITSSQIGQVTVAAGTFPCQDVKYHMVSENEDGELWADPDDVPVAGMLKNTTTEQGMPIDIELTSFTKAH